MTLCIILSGIPGSGKSTWTKKNTPNYKVVSADHYFMVDGEYRFDPRQLPAAHQNCFRKFLDAVRNGENVIVDNTSTQAWEVAPYMLAAEAHGYKVKIVRIWCNPKVGAARNVHGVPEKACVAMDQRMRNDPLMPWWNVENITAE